MKRKKDIDNTSWSVARTKPVEVKAIEQAMIDREQSKQIDKLVAVDEGHDKLLLLGVVLGFIYGIWLTAITGVYLFK